MTAWIPEELRRIGGATELQIASQRSDGTMRPYVTIWVVQAGDDLYVRTAYGTDNPWFRRTTSARLVGAAVRAAGGGDDRDVGGRHRRRRAFGHPVRGTAWQVALDDHVDRVDPAVQAEIKTRYCRATWTHRGTIRRCR